MDDDEFFGFYRQICDRIDRLEIGHNLAKLASANFSTVRRQVVAEALAGVVDAEEFRAARTRKAIAKLELGGGFRSLQHQQPRQKTGNFSGNNIAAEWRGCLLSQVRPIVAEDPDRMERRNVVDINSGVWHGKPSSALETPVRMPEIR